MGIFLMWIIFSFVVGLIGKSRNIGFGGAFIVSLLLSPLIGVIITSFSKSLEDIEKDKIRQEEQDQARRLLLNLHKPNQLTIVDELESINKLKRDGLISEEEYIKLRSKLMDK